MPDTTLKLVTDPAPTKVWVEAVAAVAAGLDHVGKTQQSGDGYMYRGIDSVINALHPLLAEHLVVIVPVLRSWTLDEWTGYRHNADNNPWTRVSVIVDYRIIGPDGSSVTMTAIGEGIDNSDKGIGKAMSYAFKAFASQLFSIPTDDPNMDNEHARSDHVELAGDNVRKRLLGRTKSATTHPEWELYREQLIDAGVLDPETRRAPNPISKVQAATWDEIIDSMTDAEPATEPVTAPVAVDAPADVTMPDEPAETHTDDPGPSDAKPVSWWWALVPEDVAQCTIDCEAQGLMTKGGVGTLRKRLAEFYKRHPEEFGPADTPAEVEAGS